MTIEQILKTMDGFLDKSSTVPFSNKKLVDIEQMHEYIDSVRLNMPSEIKRAKDTERDRRNIINQANKDSEEIIQKAEERAKILISQEEIIKQASEYAKIQIQKAEEQANAIIAQALEKDRAIREALAMNLNTTLVEASQVLSRSLSTVNETREAIAKIGMDSKAEVEEEIEEE